MTRSTLERARTGSEEAFRELVAPYRRELHLHCYRMLGSLVDAEDLLQETLLAAWRGLDGFAGRSSVRAWLYRIATNRCLNALRDSGRRVRAEPVPPFEPPPPSRRSEVTWLQPYPDSLLPAYGTVDRAADPEARYAARETVELAFVAALQELPPRQVAVLLLCDVLDFSIAEVAPMLDTTENAVKGALQRARASVSRRAGGDPPPSPSPSSSSGGSEEEQELARRFARAFADNDVDGVIDLLTDDAWLAMPPAPHEYHGLADVRAFLRTSTAWLVGDGRRAVLVPTGANGRPAFGCYHTDPAGDGAVFNGIIVLTVRGDRIAGITRFLDAGLAEAFGMEPTRPA